MGYRFRSTCYDVQDDALAAYWQSVPPAISSGSTSIIQQFVWNGAGWRSQGLSIDATGNTSLRYDVPAPAVTFPSCDVSQRLNDGMTVGWLVVSAIVGAWAVRLLIRQLGVRH
jgi:hypothetical protein